MIIKKKLFRLFFFGVFHNLSVLTEFTVGNNYLVTKMRSPHRRNGIAIEMVAVFNAYIQCITVRFRAVGSQSEENWAFVLKMLIIFNISRRLMAVANNQTA